MIRSVLVMGMGRVGSSLAPWLASGGLEVRWWNRSPLDAELLDLLALAGVLPLDPTEPAPELVLAALPEALLPAVPGMLAKMLPGALPLLVHTSGGAAPELWSDYRGAKARMHPLLPFTARGQHLPEQPPVLFLVGGDEMAARAARELVLRCNGRHLDAPVQLQPALYHAACVLACNFPAFLGASAQSAFQAAGLTPHQSTEATTALMASMLELAGRVGFGAAVSGPASRGETPILQQHARALAATDAELAAVYELLAATILRRRELLLDGAKGNQ
jgi:predicted short-subunit dehydrogenase-like oxidoreductase (DUF2520 family)